MNISNGISSIQLNSSSNTQKIYTWPKYDQGPIKKINKINKRPNPESLFTKPSSTEQKQILQNKNQYMQTEYTKTGLNNTSTLQPGTLFNALA